jgi:hypothetical protein
MKVLYVEECRFKEGPTVVQCHKYQRFDSFLQLKRGQKIEKEMKILTRIKSIRRYLQIQTKVIKDAVDYFRREEFKSNVSTHDLMKELWESNPYKWGESPSRFSALLDEVELRLQTQK